VKLYSSACVFGADVINHTKSAYSSKSGVILYEMFIRDEIKG